MRLFFLHLLVLELPGELGLCLFKLLPGGDMFGHDISHFCPYQLQFGINLWGRAPLLIPVIDEVMQFNIGGWIDTIKNKQKKTEFK